ncbi:MAG TPA: hypothetical protein VFJ96_08500 [Gemmatimonadaceae bacterium]|nr:hypothetical protein [Gemmatimonadaceae bacterium]
MRAIVVMAALATISVGLPRAARAQDTAVRFEITSVGDSTFSFAVGHHSWVRTGAHGIAVDPARRDALIARFTVVQVNDSAGQAKALVTGQTTRVTTDHVALLMQPSVPWYRKSVFWIGTAIGAVVGAVIAKHPF